LSDSTWQGRKGTAVKAVESARPDSKARPVTVKMLRAVPELQEMTESEAKEWLEHFYALADVTVEAFKEQRSRGSEFIAEAELFAVMPHSLTPTAAAA
jgi:hypothetical protein